MSLAEILGQMMAQGGAGPAQGRMRQGAGGLEQMLGAMLGGQTGGAQTGAQTGGQGALGGLLGAMLGGSAAGGGGRAGGIDAMGGLGRAAPGGAGGLGDLLGAMLGGRQDGGARAAQAGAPAGPAGGLGDLLGMALGGGNSAAAGNAAMAVLGGLAMTALKNFAAQPAAAAQVAPAETRTLTGEDAERLVLRAMLAAMKADGRLDADEKAKLEAHIARDGVTQAEVDFVHAELAAPIDLAGIAAQARGPAQAAQLYAAALVAIEIDTEQERRFLRAFAQALGLDAATVARLHQMTGSPTV